MYILIIKLKDVNKTSKIGCFRGGELVDYGLRVGRKFFFKWRFFK